MGGTLLGHVSLLPRQTILEAYRSYHSSNGTILAADLRKIFGDTGPVLGRI